MLAPCLTLNKEKWNKIYVNIINIIIKEIIIFNLYKIIDKEKIELRITEELKKVESNEFEKLQFFLIKENIFRSIININIIFKIRFKTGRFAYESDFDERSDIIDVETKRNNYSESQNLCFNLSEKYYQVYLPIPLLEIVICNLPENKELFYVDFNFHNHINGKFNND